MHGSRAKVSKVNRDSRAFSTSKPSVVAQADSKANRAASVVSNPSHEIGGWMFLNRSLLAVNKEEASKGTDSG